ncbi:MAG: arsenate reductase (azurin) small subunit [Emcibacter sp.]|nr:arsenate reductase (azurin) small subunit [Emcibacter sp.]
MSEIISKEKTKTKKHAGGKCLVNRRKFLLYSGATIGAAKVVSLTMFPGTAEAATMKARIVGYPRMKIASLKDLKKNDPIEFNYPDDGMNTTCVLIRTDIECGGGIGTKKDIVAFSAGCTHQGGPLQDAYKVTGEHRTLGQCPFHLSLFDVRRHGIIVSGQAYESLPQILLEIEGDDVYAVGMLGLLFGRNENMAKGEE